MNQIGPKADYKGPAADVSPVKTGADLRAPGVQASKPRPPLEPAQSPNRAPDSSGQSRGHPAKLTKTEMQLLQRMLTEGDLALARRSDMGELYKRIVTLFETLNQGVGEMYVAKAEQDRSMLSTRIDGLEDAVNRMEGALRIEFEPVLRQTLSQVVAEQSNAKPARRGRVILTVGILLAGLALGTVFHTQIRATVSDLETFVYSILSK